jgi:hypothetical protein
MLEKCSMGSSTYNTLPKRGMHDVGVNDVDAEPCGKKRAIGQRFVCYFVDLSVFHIFPHLKDVLLKLRKIFSLSSKKVD